MLVEPRGVFTWDPALHGFFCFMLRKMWVGFVFWGLSKLWSYLLSGSTPCTWCPQPFVAASEFSGGLLLCSSWFKCFLRWPAPQYRSHMWKGPATWAFYQAKPLKFTKGHVLLVQMIHATSLSYLARSKCHGTLALCTPSGMTISFFSRRDLAYPLWWHVMTCDDMW
jgi:hypothetical protein